MELCGCKQATAHCTSLNPEHTKNSIHQNNFPQRQKANSNLLINSKTPPEIDRISFGRNGKYAEANKSPRIVALQSSETLFALLDPLISNEQRRLFLLRVDQSHDQF